MYLQFAMLQVAASHYAQEQKCPEPVVTYQLEHGQRSPFGNGQCFTNSIQGEGMGIEGDGLGIDLDPLFM